MTPKLGTTDATLRLGSAAYPTKAYLGDTLVAATVPGAPEITAAGNVSGGFVTITHSVPDDNGSAVTSYVYRKNGQEVSPTASQASQVSVQSQFSSVTSGDVFTVAAVNAVGEGPQSDPETVTAA